MGHYNERNDPVGWKVTDILREPEDSKFSLFSPEVRFCMFFQNIGKFLAHCMVLCLR